MMLIDSLSGCLGEGSVRGGLSSFAPSQFRAVRRRHRLSVESVAIALGVSASTVRKWENGTSAPQPHALVDIAELFNRPTSDFLREPEMLTLRYLRERAGMTGAQLATLAGVTANDVSRVERGAARPVAKLLDKMSAIYQLPAADLLALWERGVARERERVRRAVRGT